MKRQWSKSEKLLFLAPFLLLAFYLFNSIYARSVFRHPLYLLSLAFSPDGKSLATGCGDNSTRVWDVETGRLNHLLEGAQTNVVAVAFSPDGKWLASSTGSWEINVDSSNIRVWDFQNKKPVWEFDKKPYQVNSLAFSPDGKTLASAGTHIRLWNMNNGKLLRTIGPAGYQLFQVAFAPDGKTVAGSDFNGQVQLWNVDSGKPVKSFDYSSKQTRTNHWVRALAISPDGKTIAAGGSSFGNFPNTLWVVKLWDVKSGALLHSLKGLNNDIRSIAFSPDSRIIAAGGYSDSVKLWAVPTGKLKRDLPVSAVAALAFSPDGKQLATGDDNAKVRMWDM